MRGAEAFEVNNKEVGGTSDDDTFRGFAIGAAARAVPEFVAGEDLFCGVGSQAVV